MDEFLPRVDEWIDWLRVLIFVISVYSVVGLIIMYRNRQCWRQLTVDIWYALLMWSLTAIVIAVQGLFEDAPFSPRSVFVTAATLVTGKLVHDKNKINLLRRNDC